MQPAVYSNSSLYQSLLVQLLKNGLSLNVFSCVNNNHNFRTWACVFWWLAPRRRKLFMLTQLAQLGSTNLVSISHFVVFPLSLVFFPNVFFLFFSFVVFKFFLVSRESVFFLGEGGGIRKFCFPPLSKFCQCQNTDLYEWHFLRTCAYDSMMICWL